MKFSIAHIKKEIKVPFSLGVHQDENGQSATVTHIFAPSESEELREMMETFQKAGGGSDNDYVKFEKEYEAFFWAWKEKILRVEGYEADLVDENKEIILEEPKEGETSRRPAVADLSTWDKNRLDSWFRAEMLPNTVNGDHEFIRKELFRHIKSAVLGYIQAQSPDYKFR